MLEQYNRVLPNGAERIVAMAESQMRHRQGLETAVVTSNVRAQARGQFLAFALGIVALGGGIGLIAFGKDAQGIASIIAALTAYAGVFIFGKREQRLEREQKRREQKEAEEQPRLPLED